MNASEALEAARAAGVRIAADGGDLLLDADSAPSAAVLDALTLHKAEILALIRSEAEIWSQEDWRVFFDERAAVAEFVGGQSRADAEAQALKWCIVEWMNQNPAPTDPDRCAWCGEPDRPGAAVVPFGTANHTWLHHRCWDAWYAQRHAVALNALADLGIAIPDRPGLHLPNDFGKNGSMS
jgi:hypothetical protein